MLDSVRPVRIADVAAEAGVSVGTASKALNGYGTMREETRARVRAAAERLRYAPSAVARSLVSGRTFTVGVITTDSYGRFSIPIMRGAEDALGLGQMAAFLCDSRDDPMREQYYLRTLLARRVDGIIVAGRRTEPRAPLGADLPVPVVYAFAPSESPADCSVVSDEGQGTWAAIEHLVRTGRTRIAHVTGPQSHASASLRAESAVSALATHGASLVGDVWFGSWTEEWGRSAAAGMLRLDPDIDAVFCGSDTIARGVRDGLSEAGRRIPEDVAIIGVDNWALVADACRPPLTSVDLNLEDVGRTSGQMLLAAIEGKPSPGVHAIPCQLVVRDSAAARGIVTTAMP
jgi:LacI family transcriptional regulator